MKRLFTSESVTEGHPDKVCDQISDAILDAVLAEDPMGRVAAEAMVKSNHLVVVGEITTTASVDYEAVIRDVIRDIGYTKEEFGFNADTCEITLQLEEQSPDIAIGVDNSLEHRLTEDEKDAIGAGDQGMMFGYACDETPELMPMPIHYAHALTRGLAGLRKEGTLPYLRPDGKAQVTVEFEDGRPKRVAAIVISTQHDEEVSLKQIEEDMKALVKKEIPACYLDDQTKYYINPTGRFVIGGPLGDSGLTGRKIIVDTYGGYARHGGGAFSGKDPTKVDRSAAYAARWVAKNIVAAGLARKAEIQLAYAIGVAHPVSIMVDTHDTGIYNDMDLAMAIDKVFDLRPGAIIEDLKLRRPIYRQVAAYGHMGRPDLDLSWERTDKVDALREALAGVPLLGE